MLFEKNYLTVNKVAELLMTSSSTVRLWVEKGELSAMLTAGGHIRFKLEDIKQFARDRKIHINIKTDKKLKVLIVDDETIFAEYLQDVLETKSDDVIVKISPDGFDAGIKLRDFAPNVVLLDLMMPGFDGFRVCKQIKQDYLFSHTKVIAMSGSTNEKTRELILSAGAEACLAKPINVSELLQLLNIKEKCLSD